eukprot:TRINITY_DN21773_c0_g1_i1.p1 TRINITY_DN21773_c0_g1~~TRINITY_DN21773_c0_g1_i1.p1  ORF type:complete len:270 (-),score=98.50 TRINITY_DN21773_c0_g1_i1:158-940(-)
MAPVTASAFAFVPPERRGYGGSPLKRGGVGGDATVAVDASSSGSSSSSSPPRVDGSPLGAASPLRRAARPALQLAGAGDEGDDERAEGEASPVEFFSMATPGAAAGPERFLLSTPTAAASSAKCGTMDPAERSSLALDLASAAASGEPDVSGDAARSSESAGKDGIAALFDGDKELAKAAAEAASDADVDADAAAAELLLEVQFEASLCAMDPLAALEARSHRGSPVAATSLLGAATSAEEEACAAAALADLEAGFDVEL